MRQLIYRVYHTRNQVPVYLWSIKPIRKCCILSLYYFDHYIFGKKYYLGSTGWPNAKQWLMRNLITVTSRTHFLIHNLSFCKWNEFSCVFLSFHFLLNLLELCQLKDFKNARFSRKISGRTLGIKRFRWLTNSYARHTYW